MSHIDYWRRYFEWQRRSNYDPLHDLENLRYGTIQIDKKQKQKLVKRGLVEKPFRRLQREGRTVPGYYQLAPKTNTIAFKLTNKGVKRLLRQLDKKVKRTKTYGDQL